MRILLVDPDRLLREGIKCLFQRDDALEVVGETDDGRKAVEMAAELRPDLVLTEVTVPELNGADLTRRILSELPAVKVLVLSERSDAPSVRAMFDAGATGYACKSSGEDELERAIRTVGAGKVYLDPEVAGSLVERRGPPSETDAVFTDLTPREREVLQLVAEGHTSKEIGALLHVTANTVDTHRHNLMRKLDAHTVADLVKLAIRAGLTTVDDC